MTALARVPAVACGLAITLGIWWASNLPVTVHRSPDAVLRVAWGARPERVETCREQSPEALALLPAHMRQPVVCEGTTATYRLEVRREGRLIGAQVVRGGGLRQDRRLYVFREFRVPPGEALVDVRFDRIEGDAQPSSSPRDGRPGHGQVPARLSFQERLSFAPRRVILVTYEPDRRELVAQWKE